ncbi:MAG: hypothetical protein JOY79_06840, partial [Acidobacteriaceae bacterium]|nr:hypothetical protein [Acidobacteriaceae bacterium]
MPKAGAKTADPEVSSSVLDIIQSYDETLPLERAWTIPGSWYTDQRIAELERRAVFGDTWQVVGRADQVGGPGQYITAEVAGQPVVV